TGNCKNDASQWGSHEIPRNPQYYRFSGRSCPSKLGKFAGVPLLTWKNKSSKVSTSLSLTALSMETPPQRYRKSVRICLVNAFKKIIEDEHTGHMAKASGWCR
ncbi:nudix hydrolase 26, chloroplastic-like, partial [Hevea brasiliensis]|uniref:nudix hydrolase 26, chloroplastic-like n=1 Tax=Hevea brasiliensis TaxID=3981 RepID=UPI0025F03834